MAAAPPPVRGRRASGLRCTGALTALFLLVLLPGCAAEVDPTAGRLCRVAAVALLDSDTLHIDRTAPLAAQAGEPAGVRVLVTEEAAQRRHALECRFERPAAGDAPDLVSLRLDGAALTPSRLFVLKRFWLFSPDSADADPLPRQEARRLTDVPFPIAYALQQTINALPNASMYALLAAAYSLVYGLFGRINLAFGEVAAIGSWTALLAGTSVPGLAPLALFGLLLVFGLAGPAVYGIAIERLALWPLRRSTGQQGLVATVGLALFLAEYVRLAQHGQMLILAPILDEPAILIRSGDFTVTATPISFLLAGVTLLAAAAVLGLLKYSRYGRAWRATADDAGAAALFGIDPRALSLQTFILAAALAGLAGGCVVIASGTIGATYTTSLGIKSLIAAIVGGIGSVPGAFLGGLAIALVEAVWCSYFPIVYRDLVVHALLVVTLILRPGGFLGYRDLLPRRV